MIAMLIGSDSVSDVVLKGCPIEPVMSNPDKSERPETGYIYIYIYIYIWRYASFTRTTFMCAVR